MENAVLTSLVIRNALAREGVKRILTDNGYAVVQAVAHPDEFDSNRRDEFDFGQGWSNHIIVFDRLLLPEGETDLFTGILKRWPRARLILLDETFDFGLMSRAFMAGIHGYILEDISFQSFLAMFQLVAMGHKVAPTELIDTLQTLSSAPNGSGIDVAEAYGLRDREKTILDCLVEGMPNKVISRKLGISEATVKLTVKGIFRKMSVKNRTQAAMLAREGAEGGNGHFSFPVDRGPPLHAKP